MISYRRLFPIVVALVAIAFIGGCAKTSRPEASGKGTIRGINAVVTSPELIFKIEERSIGNVSFKTAAGFAPYDDLTYNFNFDALLPGSTTPVRLATQLLDVQVDTEYTLVITGTMANPTIVYWDAAERDWDGTETVFEADFVHLSPALGEVDVYFAPVGTLPVVGNAIGTLNFGERIAYLEFPDDDYELIITPKDDVDPLNYVYQSSTLSSAAASRVTFALFDADASITADTAVNLITSAGGSASLPDVRRPQQARLLHAALGTDRVDGFFDNDFGNIEFADVGFGEVSAYTDFQPATMPVTLTDVGNSGAVVHEADVSIVPNSKHTLILGGEPGALAFRDLADEARPVENFPVVRFTNMSVNADPVDIYFLAPGTPITEDETPRLSGLPTLADTSFFGSDEGMQEITLTLAGEITPISVPVTIDVANGDIVDIVILDTVDPTMVSLFFLNSTLP